MTLDATDAPPSAADELTIRQKIAKWRVPLTIAAAVSVLGTIAIVLKPAADSAANEPGLEVKSMPVSVSKLVHVTSFKETREFTGLVRSARSSDLSFERTGRLDSVKVNESDFVMEGQPLASIDSRNLEAKLREANAKLQQATAVLKELIAGPRKETKDAARAQLEMLRAELGQANFELERRERLREARSISQEELERARTSVRTAEARRDVAQRNLDELETGTRQEKLTAQEAVVEQMKATVKDLSVDIEKSTLHAPFAGQITRRYLDEGAMIAPGSSVLRMVENDAMQARIGLPPHVVPHMKVGEQYELTVDRQQVPAKLVRVVPEVDGVTRTQQAVFEITQSESKSIAHGTLVRIEIETETPVDGFWVPIEALTPSARGLWAVMVVERDGDGHSIVVRREVEVIHTLTRLAIIRGTIQPNDQVVVSGIHRVVPGGRVVPIITNPTQVGVNKIDSVSSEKR